MARYARPSTKGTIANRGTPFCQAGCQEILHELRQIKLKQKPSHFDSTFKFGIGELCSNLINLQTKCFHSIIITDSIPHPGRRSTQVRSTLSPHQNFKLLACFLHPKKAPNKACVCGVAHTPIWRHFSMTTRCIDGFLTHNKQRCGRRYCGFVIFRSLITVVWDRIVCSLHNANRQGRTSPQLGHSMWQSKTREMEI